MTTSYTELIQNLRTRRIQLGLTQSEVEAHIGRRDGVVSNWERGVGQAPREPLRAWCDALGVPLPPELVTRPEPVLPPPLNHGSKRAGDPPSDLLTGLIRAFEIFRTVGANSHGLNTAELADLLQINPGTLYHQLRTLTQIRG